MSQANQPVAIAPMSVEEYIQYEWTAECRHEFINGQLFEMPGKKEPTTELQVKFLFF